MHTLDLQPLGTACSVVRIRARAGLTDRLCALGITKGTRITPLHKSITGGAIAYRIRGAVLALRREDARAVLVRRSDADAK